MPTLLRTIPSRNLNVNSRWADDFDNLFEGFFRPLSWADETVSDSLIPRMDVSEHENEYIVRAEMPGVNKDDINITLEAGVLTLSGETRSETQEKEGGRVVRQERRFGRYARSLNLGKEIDEHKVKANYKDGVLELILPKSEAVKPKRVNVEIK